ncbi:MULTISPECIES: DUF1837 domain-containing protein [unclassified Janthinobacterium]|uniref:DUF1837 domain-containing protein n=1 Tax=unclassified Janthinobacterium TaxID=2610881 RepID=UPI00161AC2A8|nr:MULTISPECIES: DUF1837 domain-containing protein [unclassified Janthinobacterium]MBB5368544.1 hypothetical protein [Janthinobacterium sp. K2C7]MBB5381920.1 hypothetical protein [Janthinobacterium sp. K2Li3]MBB5386926.1 hypothetical protein [Janthinobacterium sp. K2E3]
MAVKDIRHESSDDSSVSLCIIDDLSDELKGIIKLELSKVCHGPAKAEEGRKSYAYEPTIREFVKRYKDKSPTTKLGMIGELLCHILLFSFNNELKAASPFFNMEEGSIKKGFDLMIINSTDNSFWITEVKSGELGEKDKQQKIRGLIDLAKSDLIERLTSKNATIWYSAINNIDISLSGNMPEKKILKDLLEEFIEGKDEIVTKDSKSMNVFLVPILFENTLNSIDLQTIKDKHSKLISAGDFSRCLIFAIQKSTIIKVEKFLIEEAEGASK